MNPSALFCCSSKRFTSAGVKSAAESIPCPRHACKMRHFKVYMIMIAMFDFFPFCFSREFRAEVPCSHAVQTARASLADNPGGGTPALRRFAALPLRDAETGVHRIFQETGLAAPVPVSHVDVGLEGTRWPVLRIRDWVRYLLDTGRLWKQLCGVPTMRDMTIRLEEFWRRFRRLHPEHDVFRRAECGRLQLPFAVPIWSHSDEGRSQKQRAIMVLSVHGCLGRGTQAYLDDVARDSTKREGMGLNFVGPSWSTQFLFAVMLRDVYAKKPEILQRLAGAFASELAHCATDGVADALRPNNPIWLVPLGTKGDLVALCKLGSFERSYARVPKTGQSKTLCSGICHLCLAGRESEEPEATIPFEDLSSSPAWHHTMFQERPWRNRPAILEGAMVQPEAPEEYFRLDIWHNFHMGVAKTWLASSFIVFCNMNLILGASVLEKFDNLTSQYRDFCHAKRLAMHIQGFTRDTLGISSDNSFPAGHWNKGAASTNLMLFLQFLCERLVIATESENPLLLAVVAWLSFTRRVLLFCYSVLCWCLPQQPP